MLIYSYLYKLVKDVEIITCLTVDEQDAYFRNIFKLLKFETDLFLINSDSFLIKYIQDSRWLNLKRKTANSRIIN